jgi:hypothetical protein
MRLSGHVDFKTTHQFYPVVADDLIDRARAAASAGIGQNLAHTWHAPAFFRRKGLTVFSEGVMFSGLRKSGSVAQ